MEYLLKASLVLIIFYGCYKLFLQRDTFFQSNRWFLLIGLLTTFTLPFVIIPIYIEYTPTPIEHLVFNEPITTEETIETPVSLWYYLGIIYLIGFSFFALRFCIQLVSLLWLIVNNKKHKQHGYTLIETTNNTPPFSFFRWMVYNPKQFNSKELKHIISHERVHVKQYHTLDIIISQLASITFWFNPISWFYKKDLQQNLEFIADYKALNNTFCTKSYQELLLKTSVPDFKMALTNNFYSSLIKKRIVMLHKSKSKKQNLFKYAFVLPFLALFLMSFNIEEVYVAQALGKDTNIKKEKLLNNIDLKEINPANTYNTSQIPTSKDITIIFNKDLTDSDLQIIKKDLYNEDIIFTYTNVKRNSKGEILSILTKFETKGGGYVSNNPRIIKNAIEPFVFYKNESSFGVRPLNPKVKEIQDKINLTPFSVTITKDFTNQDLEDAIAKAKAHGTMLNFSEIKRNTKNEIIAIHAKFKNDNGAGSITLNALNPINPFAYNQDNSGFGFGKPRDSSTKTKTYSYTIKADTLNFTRGSNMKSSDSLNFYTYNISNDTIIIKGLSTIQGKEPLYIIDSVEVGPERIKSILPNRIQSVTVLKDAASVSIYGEKAKNGVVIITTKKDWETKFIVGKPFNSENNQEEFVITGTVINTKGLGLPGTEIEIKGRDEGAVSDFDGNYSIKVTKGDVLIFSYKGMATKAVTINNDNKVNVILEKNNTTIFEEFRKALFIIDGKEETYTGLENLDPNTIESITVLKNKAAIEKYGDKGKNGVIIITTKKD
ncbi:M56 family metallopeptidase [Aestuariivivens marinum]|uniref:M56 family metallopeptidase n=1 Tax=Aestuariivivens marinum TaxID=2913555 RepID=UPI001F5A4C04|nr:M56 family metallopeptidase [Aestuariivivens marinum]